MPRWPGFIGGSHTAQSLIANSERTVNLFTQPVQSRGSVQQSALLPTPGFQAWSVVPDVGARGACVANGQLFFVVAGGFYEFSSTGVYTKRGTVAQDGNPAQLVYNGVIGGQVGIVSGGNVYCYTLSTTTLSAALLTGGYTHLSVADTYGLAFNPTTGKTNLSNLNDLSTWGPATFFRRSKFPDPALAMFTDPNGLIWIVGPETFEVLYDTGVGTQPWAPLSGLFGRVGIQAPFAYGISAAGIDWLARSPEGGVQVVTTKGAAPEAVSTYAVNDALATFRRTKTLSDAELLIYQDRGHTFSNLSLPTARSTWTFDKEVTEWAERGRWDPATGTYDVWAPRVHVDCFGMHLVGDRTTGTIWQMDSAFATDIDGNGIRRLRRTQGLMDERQRIPINRVELLMDVGLGAITGAGSDPQVTLRVSPDGGRTWGNERRASIGKIGEYRKRVYFDRLGALDDAVLEFVWSDPSPVMVVDAFVNNMEGARAA